MSLAPLLNAPVVVQAHAFAAIFAFLLGVVQLMAPKGTLPHRALGYLWCALMLIAAFSSFRINNMNQWHGFSLIHLLSITVLIMVPVAIAHARAHRVVRHKRVMVALFALGLVIAGLFTFLPGRLMHEVLFGV